MNYTHNTLTPPFHSHLRHQYLIRRPCPIPPPRRQRRPPPPRRTHAHTRIRTRITTVIITHLRIRTPRNRCRQPHMRRHPHPCR